MKFVEMKNLKSALVLFAWVATSFAASAQLTDYLPSFGEEEEPAKVRMGLHLMPSVAWMLPRDIQTVAGKPVVRFGFAFTADIHFSETYSFGSGLNVFHNGGRVEYIDRVTGDPNSHADDTTSFIVNRLRNFDNQWVEVPLTFKLRTKEIGYITYWGQFGLGLGLNIRSTARETINALYKEKLAEDGTAIWEVLDTDIHDVVDAEVLTDNEVNIMRAAMILGLGIEYNMSGSTSLLVGATFNNGLFNVISGRNHGADLAQEHLETVGEDRVIDLGNLTGYDISSIDNAVLLTVGFLF